MEAVPFPTEHCFLPVSAISTSGCFAPVSYSQSCLEGSSCEWIPQSGSLGRIYDQQGKVTTSVETRDSSKRANVLKRTTALKGLESPSAKSLSQPEQDNYFLKLKSELLEKEAMKELASCRTIDGHHVERTISTLIVKLQRVEAQKLAFEDELREKDRQLEDAERRAAWAIRRLETLEQHEDELDRRLVQISRELLGRISPAPDALPSEATTPTGSPRDVHNTELHLLASLEADLGALTMALEQAREDADSSPIEQAIQQSGNCCPEADSSDLVVANRNLTQALAALQTHISVLEGQIQHHQREIKNLKDHQRMYERHRHELGVKLHEEKKKSKRLMEDLAEKNEQLEAVENINTEISNEYNRRLTKFVTESDDWKNFVMNIVRKDVDTVQEWPKTGLTLRNLVKKPAAVVGAMCTMLSPRGSMGSSRQNPIVLRSRCLAVSPTAVTSNAPLSSSSSGLRSTRSIRSPCTRAPRCARNSLSPASSRLRPLSPDSCYASNRDSLSIDDSDTSSESSNESFCEVGLIDEAMTEVVRLKLQNRVLESNLNTMHRLMLSHWRDTAN